MAPDTETPRDRGGNPPNTEATQGQPNDTWKLLDCNHKESKELQPGSRIYKYNEEEHGKILLQNIRQLWNEKKLLDVRMVTIDRKEFAYHGILLAACSSIFRTILASEQVQMYNGMFAPRDVNSDVLINLTNCLYEPNKFTEKVWTNPTLVQFAQYFGLEELMVNSAIDTSKFLKNLHQMYTQRCMTFTKLKAGERVIPCHTLVLAVASPKLRDDILPRYQTMMLPYEELEMDGHNIKVVEKLLNFIYAAQLDIATEYVEELLHSSCALCIPSVTNASCDFIFTTAKADTVIGWRNIAKKAEERHQNAECANLVSKLEEYVVSNFKDVMRSEEFHKLATYDDIVKFIVKAKLNDVEKKDILKAMLQWYEQDKDGRLEMLPLVFALVNIIKDPDQLVKVLTRANAQADNGLLGVIATVIAMRNRVEQEEARNPDVQNVANAQNSQVSHVTPTPNSNENHVSDATSNTNTEQGQQPIPNDAPGGQAGNGNQLPVTTAQA